MPFTDGLGNIHVDLANVINTKFRLRFCTAYQIRIAGYKGVLMLKEAPMKGLVEVRPSMRKFKGQDWDLGIIRCATYSVAYLNRQVIMLLSSLKVPDHVFLEKQSDAKRLLDKRVIVRNLLSQVSAYLSPSNEEAKADLTDLHREFELHFGPSPAFK